jgi:hypothetical protein
VRREKPGVGHKLTTDWYITYRRITFVSTNGCHSNSTIYHCKTTMTSFVHTKLFIKTTATLQFLADLADTPLPGDDGYRPPTVSPLLVYFFHLLSFFSYLMFSVCCLIYAVCCMLYAVCCMLFAICTTGYYKFLLKFCFQTVSNFNCHS